MKKRWRIYIIIGVLFGVFDFYYQELTAGLFDSTSTSIWPFVEMVIVACSIWLVPVIPIIIYESKVLESRIKSAIATVVTWSASIISYYIYMELKVIFIGQKSLPFMHISHSKESYYWNNVKSMLLGQVKAGIIEWIGVAVIGGFITGFLISAIYLRLRKTRISTSD